MAFKDPGTGGDSLPLNDLIGALLLIDVHEHVAEILTANGPATPIRADVAVLDGQHKGDRYDDTLLWGKILQSQLRTAIGEQVLGRLGQGKAKPGQSAPWQLAAANDADRAVAERYMQYRSAQVAASRVVTVEDEEPF